MNREAIRIAARALAGQFREQPDDRELAVMIMNFDSMRLQGPEGSLELERLRALPREEAIAQIVSVIKGTD